MIGNAGAADRTSDGHGARPSQQLRIDSGRFRLNALELRVAVPADADAVAEYHERCFEHTFSERLRAGSLRVPDRAGMTRQLHDWFFPGSGFETRVVVDDGSPIAHLTVSGHQLVHLFVEPRHQGSGLGRHLLAHAEGMIAAAGHEDLELHTRVDNVVAIAFYESAGWTVTDQRIHTVEHGISYDEQVLVKHVRAEQIPVEHC